MAASPRALLILVAFVVAVGSAGQWWRSSTRDRLGSALAAAAQPGDIRMLSSVNCVYCTQARRWLLANRVRFDECFIERDALCRQTYEATGSLGTPTLLVKGQVHQGFDAERVLKSLDRRRS